MKDKWGNYAIKSGKVKSCYQREYCNRSKKRKAAEASHCNSYVQSREIQPETQKEIGTHEIFRKEKPSETHFEGQQGIQAAAERRSEAEKADYQIEGWEKEMKEREKEKMSVKEKKHEARETKKQEKLEDRKEAKKESAKRKK